MSHFPNPESSEHNEATDVLTREFYSRETVEAAKALLGKVLVRRLRRGALLEARIVEVEAYRGRDDPASHAFGGKTERNRVMFEAVGIAYIYFIYGNHYCLNVSARSESQEAGAILLRAAQPLTGVEQMMRNRGFRKAKRGGEKDSVAALRLLTNGPGKLTKAMQITRRLNGADMTNPSSELLIRNKIETNVDQKILSTSRVGIREGQDKPWRFYIRGSPFISRH